MDTGTSSLTKRTIPTRVNHDDVCDVYFCSRPIWLSNIAFSVSSSGSGCGDPWHHHWSVAFEYGPDRVLICEAAKDASGRLQGRWMWINKCYFKETNPNKKKLGSYNIHKDSIENAVRNISNSGHYHLTKNNCQNWVLQLLELLRIKPPEGARHAKDVVGFIRPVATVGGSAAIVSAPVLMVLSVVPGGIALGIAAVGATAALGGAFFA
ncbi:uncharacterized protein LOC144164915 [Haemaphysalis longicornis]